MKRFLILIMISLLIFPIFSLIISARYHDITIDGIFGDWSGVPLLVGDARDVELERYDLSECYMANSNPFLFIRVDRYAPGGETYALSMSIYLDTDQNADTGASVRGIGADYYVGFSYGDPGHNSLFRRSGASWIPVTDAPFAFGTADSRCGYETRLFQDWIGNPGGIDVVFWIHNLNDQAPDSGYVSFYPWPTAHIEDVQTDKSSYSFGDQIELRVDVDTNKPSQDIKWLAELFDPNGNRQDYIYWQEYTVYGTEEDYWIPDEYLDIPSAGVEGSWRIRIRLRDQEGTDPDEDVRSIYRDVGEAPVPDFSIQVDPESGEVQVPPGGSKTAQVTITPIEGYSYTVYLSASGQPSGVTVTFNPDYATPTFTSTMTIQVESTAPIGSHPIAITGTGSDSPPTVHSETYTLTLTAAPPPPRTIFLKSKTTDGLENIGTIAFAGILYDLPNSLQKADGSYTVLAHPPGSYSFHHWEYSRGVSISPAEKYSNPAQVSIGDNGELTAVFFFDIKLVFSTGEKYYPVMGLGYDGDKDITNNYANYQESFHAIPDVDQDGVKDAPAYLYRKSDGSSTVLEYWIYYAYDNKKIGGLPLWRHEHDFESVYLWIDSSFVITKIALNQHYWTNNYWRVIPINIFIGVEEGGHGMMMLDSTFNTLKPDNSDLEPSFNGVFSGSSDIATLYPWKTYTGSPLDDGFGDSSNLMKARWEWGPFPFIGTAHVDMNIFFPLISIDYIGIGLSVFESIKRPTLLISSSPVDDWQGSSIQYKYYITAPWIREEFEDPSLQSIRLGYSHYLAKKCATFIVNWATLGVKGTIYKLTIGMVKFSFWKLPDVLGIINDPANLTVIDEYGNILGYRDGVLVNEIPEATVVADNENFGIWFISNNMTNFEYSILGEVRQTYNFSVKATWFNQTIPSVEFDAIDISLRSGSNHIYEIEWTLLEAGQNGTTVSVDNNGDGTIDQIFQTGTSLESEQMFRAHNLDTGFCYATIQEAIDDPATLDGDTIKVLAGTYYENIGTTKSLTLTGENSSPIVDGGGKGIVVYVTADNAAIKGFEIRNGENGILLENVENCSILDNHVYSNQGGVVLYNSSNCHICCNNADNNNNVGIRLGFSSNCCIWNNSANNCVVAGIRLDLCPNCSIMFNKIYNNAWDGIYVDSSPIDFINEPGYCIVSSNDASYNSRHGIRIGFSINCSISFNNVSNNGESGIYLPAVSSCSVYGNNIRNCQRGIVLKYSRTRDNRIFHNNFINNSHQVHIEDSTTNAWDNGCEGNYWSDYKEKYLYATKNRFGIWDTPYLINENNSDRYPLANFYWNPGDVNHDLKVDMWDVACVAKAFGSYPGFPRWEGHADITGREDLPDDQVDMRDVALAAKNYGKSPRIPIGWINGTVRDADTGLPIPGATVTAYELSGVTDAAGFYELEVVPGTYDVTADMTGYVSTTYVDVSVGADEIVTVDFALSPAVETETAVFNPDTLDSNFIFSIYTMPVGSRFNATVRLYDAADLFAYLVNLNVNDSLLNITNAWIPEWDAEWVFSDASATLPIVPVFYDLDADNYIETVKIGGTILIGESVSITNGLLCIIEFEIISAPITGLASCNLSINNTDTYLLGLDLNELTTIKTDGYYEIQAPAVYIA